MMLKELRFGWALLATLMAITLIGADWSLIVIGITGVAIGAVVLFVPSLAIRATTAINRLLHKQAARMALIVLAALFILVALVFSVAMAVFLITWCIAPVFLVAAVWGEQVLENTLLGGAATALAVCLVLGAAELVFHMPALAWEFGTPAERAMWETRYDHVDKRNILHIRSPYETVARQPDTVRIVTLGDSFTRGEVVAGTNDLWPARHEQQLGQGDTGIEMTYSPS